MPAGAMDCGTTRRSWISPILLPPRLRGTVDFPDERGPNGLVIAGQVAFAAGGRTVQAVDISDPDGPREVAHITTSVAFHGGEDDAHDLVLHDGHLFVTAQT